MYLVYGHYGGYILVLNVFQNDVHFALYYVLGDHDDGFNSYLLDFLRFGQRETCWLYDFSTFLCAPETKGSFSIPLINA